jgi:clan AA aspartic protease
MGLTHIRARVSNPMRPRRSATIRFMVDSGAVYSVIPGAMLRRLGIQAHSSRTFILADGTEIRRRMGNATFRIGKQSGTSTVIFGEQDDAMLLGVVTLEELGLVLDPLKRVLRPLPMVLGGENHHRF